MLRLRFIIASIIFLLLGAAWIYSFDDYFLRMSDDYHYRAEHEGHAEELNLVTNTWEDIEESMYREDVVINREGSTLTIRSLFRGISGTGDIIFEGSSRYGVDEITGENIAGYGEVSREGYYSFPRFVEPRDYLMHSPEVVETHAVAEYVGVDSIQGLKVYKFDYSIEGINKTEFFPSYMSLNQIIIGDHSGSLYVEPISGHLVFFEHEGQNYLINRLGKKELFQRWHNKFNDVTVKEHVHIAKNERFLVYVHTFILPGIFTIFGLITLFYYLYLVYEGNFSKPRKK